MSAREPQPTKNKPTPKKLRLSKETLKDLTDQSGSVKGGYPETFCRTCSCARC